MITITKGSAEFIREPLNGPFGFKGKYVDELWQIAVKLETKDYSGIGLGVQSILWSDSSVFGAHTPSGGNAIMFAMTDYAVTLANGFSFNHPGELLDYLLPKVFEYGKKITGKPDLRMTFALNSLVPVDFAAWVLYAKENHFTSFDQIIPEEAKAAMSYKNKKLARIPLITYGFSEAQVQDILKSGDFFLKIKIGSDPEGDNDKRKMLEWDKKRISFIYSITKDIECPYTENGKIPYYLDANGRYDSVDMLAELLDHAKSIGALDRIILLEEPFDEANPITDVTSLPARLAADESAHCSDDAVNKIAQGYRAVALKPIAKTLTMSFRILAECYKKNIPCFCADLTVNPIMAEWNKNFAARLAPLPGMKIGVVETNGYQNYKHWDELVAAHPQHGAGFINAENGIYSLPDEYFENGGGIFEDSPYYEKLFK